ncbi:uncharacterized protein BP5553_04343 [Venustampulla echinocandica]|uniref:RNA helicase n=1 Tax=Venustampulla echinocandica TaxID=2656787 RepID=A0A370TWV2_9HELO|nr:uncharacterized protein BP5553_04343 [Venustampulla echinocandica]RDL40003.1 hypothetical protein BP5553_04343 [Venustampulla echinocandica]
MRRALRKPGKCTLCVPKSSNSIWSSPSIQPPWQARASLHTSAIRYRAKDTQNEPKGVGRRVRSSRGDEIRAPPLGENRSNTAYGLFAEVVWEQCKVLKRTIYTRDVNRAAAWGLRKRADLDPLLKSFTITVQHATNKALRQLLISKEENPLFYHLRQAFIRGHIAGLHAELTYRFLTSTLKKEHSSRDTTDLQQKLADFSHPIEWYPGTRALQRTIHLHVGPTNSGKTYHALKRLEEAKSGIYAGPLRLLAHEVYTRFNAKGKACALITGEEFRIPQGGDVQMRSCTVEMVPLNIDVEVAVIDEIQMMGDYSRGWAWTQAFLGVKAKEVHLCGESRTVQIIKKLCATMGDKLVIHNYERLGPLQPETVSLKDDLNKLRKGDAIILFSRVQIHSMKRRIEKHTGKRCAVVYGSLPPETRAQQANLFNDPNNDYDYLVASNAVGMGLNLSIKRIIFESVSKHDGLLHRRLEIPEINQIAGRAGRFKTLRQAVQHGSTDVSNTGPPLKSLESNEPNVGYVTTLHPGDLHVIEKAMSAKVAPLMTAGIFPPGETIARMASLFPPETPFSYIVLRLQELATVNPLFHVCEFRTHIGILDLIQPYKMQVTDRIIFMNAPVTLRSPGAHAVVIELAKCISTQSGGELVGLRSFNLELIDTDINDHPDGAKGYLRAAETLHNSLTVYLWLSYRFAGIFRSQALAFHVKTLVEEKIDQCLAQGVWSFGTGNKHGDLAQQYKRAKELEESGFGSDQVDDVEDEDEENEEDEDVDDVKAKADEHDSEDSPASDANSPTTPEWDDLQHEKAAAAAAASV